jgi:hypothetical protein
VIEQRQVDHSKELNFDMEVVFKGCEGHQVLMPVGQIVLCIRPVILRFRYFSDYS